MEQNQGKGSKIQNVILYKRQHLIFDINNGNLRIFLKPGVDLNINGGPLSFGP